MLDTSLNEELIEEGYIREIVSKVQTMRKEADFNVTDHIRIYIGGNGQIESIAQRNSAAIAGDTLAEALICGEAGAGAYSKEWDINGENVTIAVERI